MRYAINLVPRVLSYPNEVGMPSAGALTSKEESNQSYNIKTRTKVLEVRKELCLLTVFISQIFLKISRLNN